MAMQYVTANKALRVYLGNGDRDYTVPMPAAIHHDPTCPTLNAHSVTDGLGRELWAVWCDHCDDWHWHGPLEGHRGSGKTVADAS